MFKISLRLFKELFLIVISVFFILLLAPVQAQTNSERLVSYQGEITIQRDSGLLIKEIITEDFGVNERHGIYRTIPYEYYTGEKKTRLNINLLNVSDEQGNKIKYETSKQNNNLVIKIGSPNILVSGQKTYIISYKVYNALVFYDDHDELYWNFIGTAWNLPIATGAVRVVLPASIAPDKLTAVCFTGLAGSNSENCQIDKKDGEVLYEAQNLRPGEGMTIVFGFPKGVIDPAELLKAEARTMRLLKILSYFFFLVLPLVIFIYLARLWWFKGRNPRDLKSIIAQYEPPHDLTLAEAAVLLSEGRLNLKKAVAASIVYLANSGCLTIKEIEKTFFLSKKDWQIVINKIKYSDLPTGEKIILDTLGFDGETVNLSEFSKNAKLVTETQKNIKRFRKVAFAAMTEKKLMPLNPQKQFVKFLLIGLLVTLALLGIFFVLINWQVNHIFLSETRTVPAAGLLSAPVIFLIFLFFGWLMPRLTEKGVQLKEYLLGFKLFLATVEKDRVQFHFSPSAHPERFAEYLPWAIVFGVEKEWAEVFKDVALARPEWFQGGAVPVFNSMVLVSALDSFSASLHSSAFAQNISTGGSGFSGGGVGGGGGGGGGGSW